MSIAAAPQFVPDSTDCQLVGYLVFDNFAETRDVDSCVLYVKQQYLLQWGETSRPRQVCGYHHLKGSGEEKRWFDIVRRAFQG